MYLTEIESFICKYKYDGESEEFAIESSSKNYLEKKISEFVDCGKGVTYTIYAVINKGHIKPNRSYVEE